MMNQVYKSLPNDKPIKSLCVVEDLEKCPKGFIPVSRTYDQDSDADLWRESGFFGRKCTRYLCLSKTEGAQDFVVQSLVIINEKDTPPQGYKTIPKTIDSEQKAWRKKQLCCKMVHISYCSNVVTDIIVLSRMKKAPEEFLWCGEINSMTLCYKMGRNVCASDVSVYPQIPYPVLPFECGNTNTSPENNSKLNSTLKSFDGAMENGMKNSETGNYKHLLPFRPAPKPPTSSYATISGYTGLEGVPFILNPKFNFSNSSSMEFSIPKPKSKLQVDQEYNYEFRTERET